MARTKPPTASPVLEEAPFDPRLPEALRVIEQDTFAKNRGFNTYEEYMYSRWDSRPTSVVPIGPFATTHDGSVDSPMVTPQKGKT